MLISVKWLKQYIPDDIPVQNEALRDRITVAFAEVENIYSVGTCLKNVFAGKIISIKSHPNAEKLRLVMVDIGKKEKLTVVCGADNISEGDIVPVVLPGGTVYNPKQELLHQEPITIKEAEIGGIHSEGMLCSQKELGIGEDHKGIWLLAEDTIIGTEITQLFQDTILEIENKSLTNRPDCFCHKGVAREIGTIFKKAFSPGEGSKDIGAVEKAQLEVKISNKDLCKRYSAIIVKGVSVKPSPLWLQLRLLSVGLRPVNNVVDATNYVMLDMGQPLHAFDLHKLKSPKIIVRNAKDGEKIVTLDGEEKILKQNHLVIADAQKPIAIAGIMGGENTDIDSKTKDIIIESANFEMYNLRKSTRELGMRTEASIRIEKGLDPNITTDGLIQAAKLITEIADGEIASEVIDVYPNPIEPKELEFDTVDATRLLGIEISKNEIIDILTSLQIEVISPETTTSKLSLRIPTFRRDLNIKEDIIEEIARIYGYDKFKSTLPERTVRAADLNKSIHFERKIKQGLVSLGFDELYTYGFTGESQYKKTRLDIKSCIKIKNPLSKELAYLRSDIVPGLLEKVADNLSYFDEFAIFEINKVFFKKKGDNELPLQPKKVVALSTKKQSPEKLFVGLKGMLLALMDQLGIVTPLEFEKHTKISYLDQNYQALLSLDGQELGYLGTICDEVRDNWNIDKNVVVFMLNFELLQKMGTFKKQYKTLPKYPSVKRDLSFWISKDITIASILDKIVTSRIDYLVHHEVTDIYPHKKDKEKQSITIQLVLRGEDKTLEEQEINTSIKAVVTILESLGAKLRK